MSVDTTYPHIKKPAGESARLRRSPRVRVARIAMDYLAYGWSPDEMCRQHPDLTKAEAHAAMAYYSDHQEEIDAEIRAEVRDAETSLKESSDSPLRLRLQAKGVLQMAVKLYVDVHVPWPITEQLRSRLPWIFCPNPIQWPLGIGCTARQ